MNLSNSWQTVRIKEVCDITSSKRIYASDYQTEGIPFYRGKEIIEKQKGVLDISTELYISEGKYNSIRSKFGVPHSGDLLLTSVGTLGIPYIIKQKDKFYFKDGNLTWFKEFRNLDSRYLYYWLLSSQGKAQLKKCMIGSSQPAFTIVLLKDMEIGLPPLLTQKKIAAILSAYDDLIENNNRCIRILEEMARLIYQEWFVNFRFPGHDHIRKVDSPIGMIPEGWEVENLDKIVQLIREGTKPGEHLSHRRYLPIDCLPRKRIALSESKPWEEAQSSLQLFEIKDVIFGAMRPYFHKVITAPFIGITRTTCFVLRPRSEILEAYALLTLFQDEAVGFANAHSQGATIPYAVWNNSFSNMPVIIPSIDILKKFQDYISPILEYIRMMFFKQEHLQQSRDILLPKLISEEIDVSELDVDIGEEAS